ncbi:MAG TPA: acetyl-CoA carboxylase biotin carboxyl carrier protein subunit [Aquaticitalea sp.]|nr:acetyl-CoA carboxylase biotin carboxyl carrier protein subunit [Aquaticitalea sp.]
MKSTSTNISHSVTINNQEIRITPETIDHLDAIEVSKNKWHVLFEEKSVEAEIIESDFKSRTYKVKINNSNYNIHIHSPLDAVIKQLGFEIGANKQISDIKAPMPGLILDVNVRIGQQVKENDPLLVLEAMKMENLIVSPREGVIKSIAVEKGNAVDKNQLLIEFE